MLRIPVVTNHRTTADCRDTYLPGSFCIPERCTNEFQKYRCDRLCGKLWKVPTGSHPSWSSACCLTLVVQARNVASFDAWVFHHWHFAWKLLHDKRLSWRSFHIDETREDVSPDHVSRVITSFGKFALIISKLLEDICDSFMRKWNYSKNDSNAPKVR